jgi:hypothetical protein
MNIDLLDQKNFYTILQDRDGWNSGELVPKIFTQTCKELSTMGIDFDINFDDYCEIDIDDEDMYDFVEYYLNNWDGDIMSLSNHRYADTLIGKMGIVNLNRMFLLLNIREHCWSFLCFHGDLGSYPMETGDEFLVGAFSAAGIIEALLRSYDTNVELNTDEIYKFLNSRKQSKNALGNLYEAKQYVQKEAKTLLLKIGSNGHNPSINETADYLYKLIFDKFGIDGVPELQTVRSWVKERKPVGHNPKLGNKPSGYKSLFDEL